MRHLLNIRSKIALQPAGKLAFWIAAILMAAAVAPGSNAGAQVVLTNTTLPNNGLQLTVNTDGSYAVAVGNGAGYTPWLVSGETGVAVGQQWYSSPTGRGLLLSNLITTTSSGTDPKLGDYNAVTQSWVAGTTPYVTEFRVFVASPLVVFEQRFPNGVGSSGYLNGVSSSFPSFTVSGAKAPTLRFLTFNDGFAAPQRGAGLGNIPSVHGQYGADIYSLQGGLPLALMDDSVSTLSTVV
ncbi:MAG: hypothetical protein M3Y56_16860, partial [Armatimonadota bacterium]|nr:hypothetical protein [Armatimonadota bacterium]